MTSVSTINVPFHGNNLYVVNYKGQPYVPMKPIVEGM
ncbi:phage antirepressor N-terminal domain-containing protein, partial [Proteus mirabilis]